MDTIADNIYKEGQEVFLKNDPTVKLIVRRYIKRIYYCKFKEDLDRSEQVFFERELSTNEDSN